MADFFVSYTQLDRNWAEWIAWHLEEQGYTVVIQSWDFVGNWIFEMDRAMREVKRTIAVLSPQYLESVYALPEWQNAFRQDPTGEKDLLVPIRVAQCELKGILAQIVYTDIVGLPEEEAKDRLLKRVRGQRGKPDHAPGFPGLRNIAVHQSVLSQPHYPAEEQDLIRLQQFQVVARDWRHRYAPRIDELRKASQLANKYRSDPPDDADEHVQGLVDLSAQVAEHLGALDRNALRLAKPYGLSIHKAVLDGLALFLVLEGKRALERLRGIPRSTLEARGLLPLINAYKYESMARVLDAAVAIAVFDLKSLPRGYSSAKGHNAPRDLRPYQGLLLASTEEGTLLLLSLTSPSKPLGVLAARPLVLQFVAAQINSEGSLDAVASDSQRMYYWRQSGNLPVQELESESLILAGAFVGGAPDAEAILVGSDGMIYVLSPTGSRKLRCPELIGMGIDVAHVYVDGSSRSSVWAIVVAMRNGDVVSVHHDDTVVRRGAADIWNDPTFKPPASDFGPLWSNSFSLAAGVIGGLSCVLIGRWSSWGTGACFLDPLTLQTVRRPERFPRGPGHPSAFAFSGSRWLLAGCTDDGQRGTRLMVFEFADDGTGSMRHSGDFFDVRGDAFDPVNMTEGGDSFSSAFVLLHLGTGPMRGRHSLCCFDWPSGKTSMLADYPSIRIWPVSKALLHLG